LQSPTEDAILNRPNIAISELAMTIKDNMPLIWQNSGSIFVPEFVEDLLSSFDKLLPALARMDNKDKTDQTPVSLEDMVSFLKNLDQNTVLVEAILDGFNAARPLMMLTTQVLAIQTLMRSPEKYAEKVNRVPQSQAFRENPTGSLWQTPCPRGQQGTAVCLCTCPAAAAGGRLGEQSPS